MTTPEEFLVSECIGSFETALQTNSRLERSFLIADQLFRFSFAGNTLAPHLLPALEHLASRDGGPPAFRLSVWDDTTQIGKLPQLPWDGELMTRRGDLQGFGTQAIHATLDREHEILSVADSEQCVGFYFVRDVARFPLYETAAPLRPLLFWLLRSRERFLVHAGAVGDETGALLLAGKGGSGKTTTALACLDSDLVHLADDYCIVSSQGEARVWNLFNSVRVTPMTLALLPFLQTFLTPDNPMVGDKAVIYLERVAPQKIARTRPLKAIVLPRVTTATESHLTPASSAAATSALAISTMLQLPNAGNETLAAIQALTAQLPCFYLDLGSDMGAVPHILRELLASLGNPRQES